jgi:hypothetical protein
MDKSKDKSRSSLTAYDDLARGDIEEDDEEDI